MYIEAYVFVSEEGQAMQLRYSTYYELNAADNFILDWEHNSNIEEWNT